MLSKLVLMELKKNENWIQASNSCLSNYWVFNENYNEIHFYDPYYKYIIMDEEGNIKRVDSKKIDCKNQKKWSVVIPTEEAKLLMMKQNVYSLIPSECLKEEN